MQRNAKTCGHCGKPFLRLTAETPIVSRSDGKTFHLALFSGPQPRPKVYGGFYRRQMACNFSYSIAGKYESTVIIVFRVEETESVFLHDIESAADKLSELIAKGDTLPEAFTFESDALIPGFPR